MPDTKVVTSVVDRTLSTLEAGHRGLLVAKRKETGA